MRNVIQKSNPYNTQFSTENNLVNINQTPGLSDRLSGLQMEDDECVCTYMCTEHTEEDTEQDECVCTITCDGVHTHITNDIDTKRDKEYALGIKYCPGLEPTLPVYTHVDYKPSTSTGRFTIFAPSTTATVLGEMSRGEAVGGEGDDQSGRRGEEEEDVRKEEAFQQTGVSVLISDLGEESWRWRGGGQFELT